MVRFGLVFLAVMAVIIGALELAVAMKFQFPETWALALDFLPGAAITFAMWTGAALWMAIATVGWIKTCKRIPGSFTAMETVAVTSVATISVMGIIVGPFMVAVWLNALAWVGAALSFVGSLQKNLKKFSIETAEP